MYIDGVVILFAYSAMCIAIGISVYALLKVIDIETVVNRLKRQPPSSNIAVPKVERRIKSPWKQ